MLDDGPGRKPLSALSRIGVRYGPANIDAQVISTPKVSVVLPTYNRASLLGRAISSVLCQTANDLELIVVDDASSDATEKVIKSFSDPRLRFFVHESNQGAAAARNTGIAFAKADLIAFQDSDDEWMTDKLQRQIDLFLSSGPDVVAVYCGFIRYHGHGTIYVPHRTISPREGDLSKRLLESNFITTATLLVQRDKLIEAGAFDPRFHRYQDWDLVIRLSSLGHIRLIDEPLVLQHATSGSITSNGLAGANALEIMQTKYKGRLHANPDIRASFYFISGWHQCLYVSASKGRKYFRKSISADPLRPKTWLALFLSYLGRRGFQLFISFRRRLRPVEDHRSDTGFAKLGT